MTLIDLDQKHTVASLVTPNHTRYQKSTTATGGAAGGLNQDLHRLTCFENSTKQRQSLPQVSSTTSGAALSN